MIDIIEIPLDVDIHEPLRSGPERLNSVKGSMYRLLWSKSMRVNTENRLIDLFQNHTYHFLDQLIITTWNTKRTPFTISFRDFSPSYGFGPIGLINNQPNQI